MARSRSALVVTLLALTLLLAALLAAQALMAARYHRVAAERALRDYSRFAAAEFARRAEEALTNATLWTVLRPAMAVMPAPHATLPPPSILADTTYRPRGFDLRAAGSVRLYFRLMLDGSEPALVTDGGTASPALRRWIADTVRAGATRLARSGRYTTALTGAPEGAPLFVAYLLRSMDPRPLVAYGFVTDERALAPLFGPAVATPLLPLARTEALPNDSLLGVEIRDAAGNTVFRSRAAFDDAFAAESGLGWQQASLTARAAVRPDAARLIIIGGLPASRLPFVLVLLALTALLLGTAVVQWRREAELTRLRSDFVANVSHELRTPLAQIRMFAETLLLGRVRSDEERRRSLAIIHRETGRLTHLVENLLAATREGGAVPPVVTEHLALARLAREVVDGFAPVAAARQVVIRLDADEGAAAHADPNLLRQVLLNLLDNTVKHGPAGQTVRVTVATHEAAVRLIVDDEGPGIAPDDRERIFERFTRLRPDSSAAGAGIGLAVVRDLVGRHGGRVWVEPAPGPVPGSRFVVELPR